MQNVLIPLYWGLILHALLKQGEANPHAKRLFQDLLIKNNYNKLIRPVARNNDTLTVKLGLRLSQLIGIWEDFHFIWDPKDYGGVDLLYVPSEDVWTPDIVLYNNADGNYQVTLMTKATLHSNGRVFWEPPAIYKSSCTIDVEFFPFDEQTCGMKFGSWTYDGIKVDLKHKDQADVPGEVHIPKAIDMSGYYRSFIWDVMAVPAKRSEVTYPCCPQYYPDVTFKITIRRKTLFYTVNLIIPCVAISFLTVFVFYLPSDSGEKITLCISILLSLTVFFLLLADLIPPTSLVVPLIGKYLLFTMILVTLSVIITVIVLNIHNRTYATHTMPPWLRCVALEILPTILCMQKLKLRSAMKVKKKLDVESPKIKNRVNGTSESRKLLISPTKESVRSGISGPRSRDSHAGLRVSSTDVPTPKLRKKKLPPEVERALEGVQHIANHIKEDIDYEQIQEEWKFMAMVIDRLFLWLFTTACLVGTFGIILQAPTLYDGAKPMDAGI
ncbi:nAChRa4 [Bugula neritina]|uniref:NAChRa4 n=1 Tax=Bugula neritina TaxID=10212 RepID=A0A7J7KEC3_BUGNE|nr:nAChRa4 [Bugula neritina]